MSADSPSDRPQDAPSGAVRATLLLSDLVDSTGLVEALGDERASEVFRRHDRVARDLLGTHGGKEIDKTDGFLLMFEEPSQAVDYALDYHRALRQLARELSVALAARVGIHLGEVIVRRNPAADVARGAKPVEVEGLAKPMAARLMSLATGGQTLVTGGASELAQRAAEGSPATGLRWVAHGRYRFKGVRQSVRVYEVGTPGEAPFRRPPDTEKARREEVDPDLPTAALTLPRRHLYQTLLGLGAVAAVAALLLAVATWKEEDVAAFSFAPRDWVVIGEFANRTGETLLDDSLDLALRAGLEQSRFVNVLPESRVRRALERMKRDGTEKLDRELGSEICQREGARALVLGSIVEVGRTYTLSAEVVDPADGRSLITETASAQDLDGVLEALGRVVRVIREKLGESLTQIDETSVPLEQVTTTNLEALKAYSLGLEEAVHGRQAEAVQLLERAIELDPEFATAHAKLGTLLMNFDLSPTRASHHWNLAWAKAERLSEREKLYVEGARAWSQADPETMRKPWFLMSNLYPDQAVGHNNLGLVYWRFLGRYAEADEAFGRSIAGKDPWIFSSFHHRGYCRLAQGRLEEALADFRTSYEMSQNPLNFGQVDALVALRRYAEAEQFLAAHGTTSVPLYTLEGRMRRVTFFADQGRLGEALTVARAARQEATRAGLAPAVLRARTAEAMLLDAMAPASAGPPALLSSLLDDLLASLATEPAEGGFGIVPQLVLVAKGALRRGDRAAAERVLAVLEPRVAGVPSEPWRAWLDLLTGELELARGEGPAAVARLRSATTAHPLFQLHESLAHALEKTADAEGARAEYQWLVDHRGLAFGEWLDHFFGKDRSVLDWTRAHLHLARLAELRGDAVAARGAYEAFLQQWGQGDPGLTVDARKRLAQLR